MKLSDALVLDARITGEAQLRSIAGQVEFWARLGRSLELLLDGKQTLRLSRASGSKSLSELLDVVDTPRGREMFKTYLASEPFPHYEAHPDNPNLLVRIDEDGTRTPGHFVNRTFVPDVASRPITTRSAGTKRRVMPSRQIAAKVVSRPDKYTKPIKSAGHNSTQREARIRSIAKS